MRVMALIHLIALAGFLFFWATLHAQRGRSDLAGGSLRVFLANMAMWVLLEIFLYFPMSVGLEDIIYRVMAVCWIPSSFWFLRFVYRLIKIKNDWIYFLFAGISLVGVLVYVTTDLGLAGTERHGWGASDIRAEHFLFFFAIPLSAGLLATLLSIRRSYSSNVNIIRKSLRIVGFGVLLVLGISASLEIMIMCTEGIWSTVRLSSCTPLLLIPFVVYTVKKFDFLSGGLTRVAEEIFEDVRDGIILVDRNSLIQRVNPAAQSMLGVTANTVEGSGVDTIINNWSSLKEKRAGEMTVCDQTQSNKFLSLSVSIVTYHSAHRGWIVLIRDLTEQQNAREVLKRSFKELESEIEIRTEEIRRTRRMEAIGTMTGSIAHDFNNLLAAIIGFTSAAKEDLPVEHKIQRDLNEVLIAANRARDIIDQMLELGRHSDPRREMIEIGLFVDRVLTLVESFLPASISLERQPLQGEAYVMGDPTQLHQAIVNLCTNGYQSMKRAGGKLVVSVRVIGLSTGAGSSRKPLEPGQSVRISVTDTGPGIDRDMLDRVFETTGTNMPDSNDMGMAMAMRIAREHEGTIMVESEKGQGSIFSLLLPVANP
jgi:PAS domain S-box-containing protein